MTEGAICGGPTDRDRLVGYGQEYLPTVLLLHRDVYRPGARCHGCGRFLADITNWTGAAMLGGWAIGPTLVLSTGRCSRHGYVEADYDEIWWGDQ